MTILAHNQSCYRFNIFSIKFLVFLWAVLGSGFFKFLHPNPCPNTQPSVSVQNVNDSVLTRLDVSECFEGIWSLSIICSLLLSASSLWEFVFIMNIENYSKKKLIIFIAKKFKFFLSSKMGVKMSERESGNRTRHSMAKEVPSNDWVHCRLRFCDWLNLPLICPDSFIALLGAKFSFQLKKMKIIKIKKYYVNVT